MGLIPYKNFEPGMLELYPWLSDDQTFPAFIKYGVHPKVFRDNNAQYHRKGPTQLDEGSYGGANASNRDKINKIPGGGILRNNGATGGQFFGTRDQMRASAEQANLTFMVCHQMQEGDPWIASASSQSFWFSERATEKQLEFFPAGNAIYAGNYGDFSMGQMDYLDDTNALTEASKLTSMSNAKAGLAFFNNTFTAIGGGTKTLSDVHSGYNCRLYPTTPLGNQFWVHRMLFMMRRYVVAGWGTKWHMLFFWPAFESSGESIAHSGWPYEFNTTNPAGKLETYGHIHIDPITADAIGFLWAQALDGVTNRCFYIWNNANGYSSDINKQSRWRPGDKPGDRWNPAPGSPSSFPYIGDGQLSYPQEPQWGFDGIHSGISRWYSSYQQLGGEGTKAFASFSTNNGSSYTDPHPGGVYSICHGLANKYGIAQTEVLGSKIKWMWYDPFATPGVARTIRLKHYATGAIHDAQTIGNKLYCYVGDL